MKRTPNPTAQGTELLMRVTQSNVNRRWNYCPDGCPLCRPMAYDEEAQFATAEAAQQAAASDPSLTRYRLTWISVPADAARAEAGYARRREADRIDGYDRDDLGCSPDY